jgi:hypothetical protein
LKEHSALETTVNAITALLGGDEAFIKRICGTFKLASQFKFDGWWSALLVTVRFLPSRLIESLWSYVFCGRLIDGQSCLRPEASDEALALFLSEVSSDYDKMANNASQHYCLLRFVLVGCSAHAQYLRRFAASIIEPACRVLRSIVCYFVRTGHYEMCSLSAFNATCAVLECMGRSLPMPHDTFQALVLALRCVAISSAPGAEFCAGRAFRVRAAPLGRLRRTRAVQQCPVPPKRSRHSRKGR